MEAFPHNRDGLFVSLQSGGGGIVVPRWGVKRLVMRLRI